MAKDDSMKKYKNVSKKGRKTCKLGKICKKKKKKAKRMKTLINKTNKNIEKNYQFIKRIKLSLKKIIFLRDTHKTLKVVIWH